MVADETTMRLIDLHKYEASRSLPVADEVYRANTSLLMHDETCYRCVWRCIWDTDNALKSTVKRTVKNPSWETFEVPTLCTCVAWWVAA